MKLILSRTAIQENPELMLTFLREIAEDAEFLRASYPMFDRWLMGKVVPGIYDGERTAVVEKRGTSVVGIMIVKHTSQEKKLCTLRVRPSFESKGLGVRLFENAFEILGTDRPVLSVSESSKAKFTNLFAHFGFAQEGVYMGRYLPEVHEFSYNGLLDVPTNTVVPCRFSTLRHSVNFLQSMRVRNLMARASAV